MTGCRMCAARGGRGRERIVLAAAVIGLFASGQALAATVPLGAASGGLAIYYNSTGGQVPSNEAYWQLQFSGSNTNGAEFNFDSTPIPGSGGLNWYGIFQVVPNQFGLDMILEQPTTDHSVATPVLTAYDNGNNTLAGRISGGPVTWAISGYTGSSNGPADPGNSIINSLFRGGSGASGDGISNLVVTPLGQVGTVTTIAISGQMASDGVIHWYSTTTPNTPVTAFELTGTFDFSATLSYDSSTDSNPLMDFYAGTIEVEAEVICGDRYVNAATGHDFFPGPTPNDCRFSTLPCQTVSHASAVACPVDVLRVAAGTYTEQVTIGKSLTIVGDGASVTTIRAPSVITGDQNHQNVVTVEGSGVTVDIGSVTISGPGPNNSCSLQAGVMVRNNATAIIHDDTITTIRDNPLSGCDSGRAVLVGDIAPPSTSATATVIRNTIIGYQKSGVDLRNSASFATISDNTISGVGLTTLVSQDGVSVMGAAAAILNNTISGNECGAPSCGPDLFSDDQSAGVLVLDAPGTVQVTNNDILSNDVGIHGAAPSLTVSGNELTSNRYEGIILDEGSSSVTLNRIDAGNIGIAVVSFTDSSANSSATVTCNRIGGAGVGISVADGDAGDGNVPTLVAHNNVIDMGSVGISNTTGLSVDAKNNWWGCVTGPNTAGCSSASANVLFTPFDTSVPACVSCANDADCSDGLACTGTETCSSGTCLAGTPVVCTGNQCNNAACAEPSGSCVLTPKINGFACDDGNVCTTLDTCQGGVCVGTGGADSDGDGYCDAQEEVAGCNSHNPLEIPPQANIYSGGNSASGGEVLLTFNSPSQKRLSFATDPACGGPGVCSLVSHFCISGKVGDPCQVNNDCSQSHQCRIVINYADTPDLVLVGAQLHVHHMPKLNIANLFTPVSPGCSRKVDIALSPGFRRAVIRLKAAGTTNARFKKDRDIVTIDE